MVTETLSNPNPTNLQPPEPPDRRRTSLAARTSDHPMGGGEPLSPRAAKKVFSKSEEYFGKPGTYRGGCTINFSLEETEKLSAYLKFALWSPEFNPNIESSIAPVWIQFLELPVHLFQKKVLFGIISLIGSPLELDEATANGLRPSVARVCVEIDLMKP
ncbi:UNVERIFIED_CONTAM: hypothetical protein Sradi_3808400 [Sesamum radiatum]|uniref:DUF4283 domain-containing protein n=1 Tax=Sesamum radiatum TaxID=300843 RepID=A0AAW2Q046_SESRA